MTATLTKIALDNFLVLEHKLYRKMATGDLRRVTTVDNAAPPVEAVVISCNIGKLVVQIDGRRLRAADIAWTLHYGNWPTLPLFIADGDPHNMAKENLLAIRGQAYRPRIRVAPGGFVHNMARKLFSSPELAREDWRRCVAEMYRHEQPHVLFAEEVQRKQAAPIVLAPVRAPRARVAPNPDKPRRPPPVAGKEWHYWQGEWVSVPVACHVADDYMVRIRAVLAGAKSFVYDDEAGRVLAIY